MKRYGKVMLFTAAGAIIGYAYYYFIGCSSGSCPLTSRWYITTIYGMFAGIVMALPENLKKQN